MAWSEDRARERIRQHIESIGEIEVRPLAREVDDLETVLSETSCRDILGSHAYASVTNFAQLSSDSSLDDEGYKLLIQSVHAYEREVSHIAEQIVGGYRVHFQGPKVHVLAYTPVNDDATAALKAAMLLLILNDFVGAVFNAEFSEINDWRIGGGGDVGNVIGTRNGMRGERELLFIGEPANQAAKIMVDRSSLRITARVRNLLPKQLQECCTLLKDGNYKISASQATLDELCKTHGIAWNREKSAERVRKTRESIPLDRIAYGGANNPIDFSGLSERNNKRVFGASIFADVSGFTKYVRDAGDDEDKQKGALKLFHVIRKESRYVLGSEHDGVQVQFQGDRIQGLLNVPKDDAAAIAREAVEIAIDLQSSFEQAVKHELPEAKPLSLAIGVDVGTTLATRLGKHGDRDNICLGEAVENAARIEERCDGGMIGISGDVYQHLDKDVKLWFEYDDSRECYVARGLTREAFNARKAAEVYKSGAAVLLAGAGIAAAAIAITRAKGDEPARVQPAKPYAP